MAVRRRRTRNSKLWCKKPCWMNKKERGPTRKKERGSIGKKEEGPIIDRPQTTQERNACYKRRQQEFKALRLV